MLNTPSFEINLKSTAPAFPDSLGKRPKKQIAPRTNCFQFVDLDVFAKSRTSPPDQLALTKRQFSNTTNMAEVPEF